MAKKQDTLFPDLPEDLSALSDEDLDVLLKEHTVAAELIEANDEEFTKGLDADELYAEYERGVEQIEAIDGQQKARVEEQETFKAKMDGLAKRRKGDEETDEPDVEETAADEPEVLAEADETTTADEEEEKPDEEPEKVEEREAVVATAVVEEKKLRRPPSPSADRMPAENRAVLVAAAGVEGVRVGGAIHDRMELASAMKNTANRWGRVAKHEGGVEQRILIANATFQFPEDRQLHASDWEANSKKIAEVVPGYIPGIPGLAPGSQALVASGGLCAPLEPIYSMPNFASTARPVRDSLPSFQASRGGVNVPTATDISSITTAITVIEEADDALGGTFATKSCQALECPAYTEVPVTVISHCREYGNLNSMAWPEKIAHENDLTMAMHARTAENYLLDRIKALSINVTAAEVLGAFGDLVGAITRAEAGIRYRLRMERGATFRVLLPAWVPDLLAADTAYTQFDRYQAQNAMAAHLNQYGISVTFYLDDVTGGTPQSFAAEVGGTAVDDFPDDIQWAIYPEGEFIHVDSGSLELGIVRDSTLNSTNDYQIFGESFENLARLGPAQGALWVVQGVCPSGEFPALGSALTC